MKQPGLVMMDVQFILQVLSSLCIFILILVQRRPNVLWRGAYSRMNASLLERGCSQESGFSLRLIQSARDMSQTGRCFKIGFVQLSFVDSVALYWKCSGLKL